MLSDCFDVASLEAFTTDLVKAGFEPVDGWHGRRWIGGIRPAFGQLTNAVSMVIVINPGWPFQPPTLLVDGLRTNHSMRHGLVCLWREGDDSRQWETVAGLFERIDEWCQAADEDWEADELPLDGYLNFYPKSPVVATFDISALAIHTNGWGEFHATVNPSPLRVDIKPGRRTPPAELRCLWFHSGDLLGAPPRELSEVPLHLSRVQKKGLRRGLNERLKPEALAPSSGVDIILFCWTRRGQPDLLALICEGTKENVKASVMLAGPLDEEIRILRAGPDARALCDSTATVFGAGALGGYVATLLAESGMASINTVDRGFLLPENVVRHIAGDDQVGAHKATAVEAMVKNHAPRTKVTKHLENPVARDVIAERIQGADIVVDATGDRAFAHSLAMVAHETGKALVSGALYRGGFIGRVQRQVLGNDMPIFLRLGSLGYPVIPPDVEENDFSKPHLGCSAPANNASPVAVMACASLIAQVAIDALTNRFECPDEVIDVYRAIPEPPFNHVGRVDQNAVINDN